MNPECLANGHEWSDLTEVTQECLVCEETRESEPDYGDWRGDD